MIKTKKFVCFSHADLYVHKIAPLLHLAGIVRRRNEPSVLEAGLHLAGKKYGK